MGTTTSKARMSVVDLGGAVLHILLFSHSCQSVTVSLGLLSQCQCHRQWMTL